MLKSHQIRGAVTVGVAGIALYILMFLPRFTQAGFAIGTLLLVVMTIGFFDLAGVLRIEVGTGDTQAAHTLPGDAPRWLRWISLFNVRLLYLGGALIAAGACRVSVIGTLGAAAPWSGPLLFVLGAAVVILARFLRRGFDGRLHEGFLVFSVTFATVMATLGSQGLWDCWETHYGEVARRQLEQDDWISLFWEDNWFFSKPILIFWMMNIGMAIFGVNIMPDSISSHAEWGARFMVALLAVCVVWSVYFVIAKRVSKRAGLFSAVVLATMPLFGFMTRQAITDMPFAGFMTLAVVLFLYGITAAHGETVRPVYVPLGKGRRLPLTGFHALLAAYVFVALPQYLYLASRSAVFKFGTLGQGDVHNVSAKTQLTRLSLSDITDAILGLRIGGAQDISLDWLLLGLLFLIPFQAIVHSLRNERRVSRISFHGMYLCLALSVMAKGLPGLVLPFLALFVFWVVVAPWHDLRRPKRFLGWHVDKARRLDLLRGIPIFLLVAAPWYVAMTVRHAMAFINRFFIHDHVKRLASGVHGESGTFQYFLEQFGFAAFPWVALFPFALLAWPAYYCGRQDLSQRERADKLIRLFLTALALVSYVLFSMMVTKFHHYVFPMIIPAAVLIGLLLDDIWENRLPRSAMVVLAALVITIAVAQDLVVDPLTKSRGVLDGHTQLVGLFIYKYSRPYPGGAAYDFSAPLIAFSGLFVGLFLLWFYVRRRRVGIVLTLLAAVAFSHFLNHHYMVRLAPHWTQKHLIDEYYALRESGHERLVAFQMNWKGENFYTGNRIIPFVSTKNKQFEKWVESHRGERHFFITEQSRFNSMSNRTKPESGAIEPLSDTCNKYKIGVADKL